MNNTITISLQDSSYAQAYKDGNRIHQQEYDKAIKLIDGQINQLEHYTRPQYPYFRRVHNTISVFGGRGSGKTSFLHSLVDYYTSDSRKKNIEFLRIIDPTILEDKGHIFLYIVSLINDKVVDVLKNTSEDKILIDRRKWNKALSKLAKGLPSLDAVGPDYHNQSWQDDDYIMEKGLQQVASALDLEKHFHELVDFALMILNKKCFILVFDDVDVDFKKGWPILECIRKYLTTPQLITIISGNLRFYSNNIRIQQWKQLEVLYTYESKNGHDETYYNKLFSQVNEIEGQFLLKIFKAPNRIHLNSIRENIETHGIEYNVQDTSDNSDKSQRIEDKYREIINSSGIRNSSIVTIWQNYLMGLSTRTQINFLQNYVYNEGGMKNLSGIETLLVRMYASGIDVDRIINYPNMTNIVILEYLVRKEILADSYLLLPTHENENVNGCVAGLTVSLINRMGKSQYLFFDYMLRVAYLRNILLLIDDYEQIRKICKYSGGYQDVALKNFIGLTMGYLDSTKKYSLKEHTHLYGLATVVKRGMAESKYRIDTVLRDKDVTEAQRCIAFSPLSALKPTSNNESKMMYSAFNLLAAIGQILKCKNNIKAILSELKNLQLLRYYPIPDDTQNSETEIVDIDMSVSSREKDESLVKLAEQIVEWIKSNVSNESNKPYSLPPYAIGRAMTRFFTCASSISADNLGDVMHRYIVAFLNAVLINEINELPEQSEVQKSNEQSEPSAETDPQDILKFINYSNAINDDRVFKYNIGIIAKYENQSRDNLIPFTRYLMRCPLILAFINPKSGIISFVDKEIVAPQKDNSVYELLTKVKVKDSTASTARKPRTPKKTRRIGHFAG